MQPLDTKTLSETLAGQLAAVVGATHVHSGEAIGERYRIDVSRKHSAQPLCLRIIASHVSLSCSFLRDD